MNIIIGLDVHSKASTKYCIQEKETGKMIKSGEFETTYQGIKSGIGDWLDKYPQIEVGMEAGNKTYYVATVISQLGGKPRVFSADEVRAKSRSKKKKSDYRDAIDLCHNLRTGALIKEVLLPPKELKQLRSILKARNLCVKQRAQVANQTRALMKEYALKDNILSFHNTGSWEKLLANEMPDFLREIFLSYQQTYERLTQETESMEDKIRQWNDIKPEFEILKTIPGIGDITCAALKAYIFDIDRFKSSKHLVSYFGLSPSCYDSGDTIHHGRITKEGNKYVRNLLIEAAHHYSNPRSCFYPFFSRLIAKKGYQKTCVTLAAKLSRIIYKVLKTGKPFDLNLLGVKKGPFIIEKKYYYLAKNKNEAQMKNTAKEKNADRSK